MTRRSGRRDDAGRHPALALCRERRVARGPMLLCLALVLGVALPLVLALVTGSLSVPHNDAWSYSRIAATFARTGQVRLLGWNRSSLVGQFVLLGPLAAQVWLQQTYVALLAGAALLAAYDLVRPLIGPVRAGLAAVVLALWPGFALLATSFMSDVPALAAMLGCLAIGRRALASGSARLLAVAVAVGFWGCTIREQALAAPVALLAVAGSAAWRRNAPGRKGTPGRQLVPVPGIPVPVTGIPVLVTGLALTAAVVAFESWRRGLPHGDPPTGTLSVAGLTSAALTARRTLATLALAASPVVALVARPWRWRTAGWSAALITSAVVVVAVRQDRAAGGTGPRSFFLGNYLDQTGPYWQLGIGRPAPVFPDPVWVTLMIAGAVSAVLLVGQLAHTRPRLGALPTTFVLVLAAGNLGSVAAGQEIFERYWLPVVPFMLAAVLMPSARSVGSPSITPARRTAVAVASLGLALAGLAISVAGMGYDVARWQAAQQLVDSGVPAVDVAAGMEWTGTHSPGGMSPDASWQFPGTRACYVVTAEHRDGIDPRLVVTYRRYLVARTARVWVYPSGSCPPVR